MSDLYEEMRAVAREFAAGEMAEAVGEDDHYPDRPFRESMYRKADEVGFLSFLLPEEANGLGETPAALSEVLYELALVDPSVAAVFLCQGFAHRLLAGAGSPELVEGKGFIASTIYDDPADLPSGIQAIALNDTCQLTGELEFMALAPVADAYIVPASLDGELAMFLVHAGEGVRAGEPLVSLGLRSCPVGDLSLELAEGVMLARGRAAEELYRGAVDDLRGAVAAISAGIVAGCVSEGAHYCKERYQGYRQIIDHGQVRAELGRIVAEGEAALELFRSAYRDGESSNKAGAIQLIAGEMAARATIDGIQVLGGYGYMQDYGQEKRFRDAKQVQAIFGRKDLIVQDLAASLL
ncbi:MAG: acyl-CoA dehydrogenase family protein [Candidatus Geothermincolia bacterium]